MRVRIPLGRTSRCNSPWQQSQSINSNWLQVILATYVGLRQLRTKLYARTYVCTYASIFVQFLCVHTRRVVGKDCMSCLWISLCRLSSTRSNRSWPVWPFPLTWRLRRREGLRLNWEETRRNRQQETYRCVCEGGGEGDEGDGGKGAVLF